MIISIPHQFCRFKSESYWCHDREATSSRSKAEVMPLSPTHGTMMPRPNGSLGDISAEPAGSGRLSGPPQTLGVRCTTSDKTSACQRVR